MISPLDAAAQGFLAGLDRIQQRAETAQRRLTTGFEINSVSDAPAEITDLWQTRSNLDAGSISFSQNYQTQLQAQISGIQDADAAQAITELTQAQTQLQAAMISRAQLPRTSLFDFLA